MATKARKRTSRAAAPASTRTDPQSEAVFACIQAAFAAEGLTPITSPLNQIVWTTIPRAVVIQLGTALRTCITRSLGRDPGDLTGALLVLGAHAPVMTVATLIADLEPLVS